MKLAYLTFVKFRFLSVFETSFKKQKSNIATYRDYKHFNNKKTRKSLIIYFNTAKNISHDAFQSLVMYTLDKMASIKQKYIQSPFVNKNTDKTIMTRVRLRNRFLKVANSMNKLVPIKQRNHCVSLRIQ